MLFMSCVSPCVMNPGRSFEVGCIRPIRMGKLRSDLALMNRSAVRWPTGTMFRSQLPSADCVSFGASSGSRPRPRYSRAFSVAWRYSIVCSAPPNDQAHRRRWSAAELPSGGAPCSIPYDEGTFSANSALNSSSLIPNKSVAFARIFMLRFSIIDSNCPGFRSSHCRRRSSRSFSE